MEKARDSPKCSEITNRNQCDPKQMIDNFMGDETKELTLMEKESMDSKFVTNLITIKGLDHAFRGGLNRDENEKA